MELLLESIDLPSEINSNWLPDLSIIDLDIDTNNQDALYNVCVYKFNLDFKMVFWDTIGIKANFRSNCILNSHLDIYDDLALMTIESKVTAKPHEVGARYQGDKWFTSEAKTVSPENKSAFNKSVYKAKDSMLDKIAKLIQNNCSVNSPIEKALIRICPKDQLVTIIIPNTEPIDKPEQSILHSFEINTAKFKTLKQQMAESNLELAKLSQDIPKNNNRQSTNDNTITETDSQAFMPNIQESLANNSADTNLLANAINLDTNDRTDLSTNVQADSNANAEVDLSTNTEVNLSANAPIDASLPDQSTQIEASDNLMAQNEPETNDNLQSDIEDSHAEQKITPKTDSSVEANKVTNDTEILKNNQSTSHKNTIKTSSSEPKNDSHKASGKTLATQNKPTLTQNHDPMPKYAIYSKSEVDNLIKLNIEAVSEQLGKKITNQQKQFQETATKQEIAFKVATDNVLKRIENIENTNKKNLDNHENSINNLFSLFKENFNNETNQLKTNLISKLTSQVKSTEDNLNNLINKVKSINPDNQIQPIKTMMLINLFMAVINIALIVLIYFKLK